MKQGLILSLVLMFAISQTVSGKLVNPVTENFIQLSDVTTNNATAARHGFLPKLDNTGTKYLRDDGTWQVVSGGGGSTNMTVNTFSGNGVSTTFTMSANPSVEENTLVYLSGVYQNKSNYSVSGTTITFNTAPVSGTNNIEVMVGTVSGTSGGGVSDGDKGDITVTGIGATWTIDNNVVTNNKAAQMPANTIKGNNTGSTANASDLTGTQATALLDTFTSGAKGLAPASGGGTTNFLRADGTWAAPSGGGGSPTGVSGTVQFNNGGTFGSATNVSISSGDLTLSTSGTTLSAPASTVKLFGRSIANRSLPAFVDPSGLDSALQPLMARNKIGLWVPPGNATTVPGVFGFTALTATGTATARNVATTNALTRSRRLGYVSAATAGSLSGGRVAAAQYTTGNGSGLGGFTYIVRFGTSDAAAVAGARAFIGLSSSTGAPTNVEPSTLTNSIGACQLSTDNTQWYLCYGGSTAQTAIALGTGIGAPTSTSDVYEIALFSSPNSNGVVGYQVTNVVTGVNSSGTLTPITVGVQTPASTTLLTPQIWRSNNATALAVGIDILSIYIETDF